MVKMIDKSDTNDYVGYEAEPSAWITMDQPRINTFADCTEDHQFIHVDEEAAKNGPFGGTIAHGFLTLSMLAKMGEDFSVIINGMHTGINYGFEKIRFLAPVHAGKRIRSRTKVLDITETKPNQFRITTEVSVEIEGETKPALVAEWLTVQLVA